MQTYSRSRLARLRRRFALRVYALALVLDVFAGRVSGLPRMAGGAPEGEGDAGGGAAAGGEGEGGGDGSSEGAGDGGGEGDPAGEGDGEGEGDPDGSADGDGDTAEIRAQMAELQQRLDAREAAEAERAREAAEAARQQRENEGDFEKLYREEREAREKLEADLARGRVEGLVLKAAKGAHNPERVAKLIDASKISSDVDARRAVDELRRTDPYLFAPRSRQQANAGQRSGTNPPAGTSGDDANAGRTRRPVDRIAAGYAANQKA